jgi:oligopeptide transport system ATP-binding protein
MLAVRDLKVGFRTDGRVAPAVHGVSFEIRAGQTLGIVGESGSGKSVTCLSLLSLLSGAAASGEAVFEGHDLLRLPERELRRIRGSKIAMIFQDPMTSLNPFLRISTQIAEASRLHLGHTREQAQEHAVRMLELVGIPDARTRAHAYPHQFSGGMRQRVMIAMALACNPKLLIADEPTTALDVTVQSQILDLLRRLRDSTGAALILISHDFGVVAGMADHIAVMYGGRIVESAPTADLFHNPQNPYTRALLRCVPDPARSKQQLFSIAGEPPDVARLGAMQCPFVERCPESIAVCHQEFPPFHRVTENHGSLCWLR